MQRLDYERVSTTLQAAMNEANQFDNLITDTATRLFRDLADPQYVNAASDDGWKEPLWRELEQTGLTLAWVPEEAGGAGAGIGAGFDILQVAGRFALAAPLAETLLAGWLLAQAGIDIPPGRLCLAAPGGATPVSDRGTITGTALTVSFAPEASHLALLGAGPDGPAVALVDMASCTVASRPTIAGDPAGDIRLEDAPADVAAAPPGLDAAALEVMGATARARQIAGALQAVLDLAVAYAGERVAFERPIGKFQAVQHNLARLAGEVAAADAVSGSAADAIATGGPSGDAAFLEAAAAKVRTGEAAGEGAAIAHQVFGAIGFTQEHVLQRFTRRLWAWRDDFGSETVWAERLGRHVAAAGADALWPMLAAR